MSKGRKQQYKQFTVNTLEDGCLVLKSLIVPVIIDLDKFQKYSKEAEMLLMYNHSVPAEIYDAIHDKILYQQRELLRFIADHQTSSFSYIAVRQLLVKKKFLKRTLQKESNEILNELLDVRNWTFHNAQSMMVADLEIARKSIPEELSGIAEVKPMLNPVIIKKIKSYSREMVEGFIQHNKVRLSQFEVVLQEMKEDYEDMYLSLPDEVLTLTNVGLTHGVQYVEQEVVEQDSQSAGYNIASLSMGIQKGKYNGSKELFEKLTKK